MAYDVYKIRKQFPMLDGTKTMQGKPLIYLDNASTTFKPQCVIDAMNKYYTDWTANAHRGDYDLLNNMDNRIIEVRKKVAKFVNCEENEVVFTSGDTMAVNLIAWGYAHKFLKKGDVIILSESEHASNTLPWFSIAKLCGAKVDFVPLNENGEITAENLKKVITNKCKIVAVAHSSNVLGTNNDVAALAKVAHEYGAVIAIDGAQSVPHLVTDFKKWDIDFLSFSAHKMCGPTGVGALIGKYDLLDKMDAFLTGGGMNEAFYTTGEFKLLKAPNKFEAGTQNLSGILGFGAAIDFLLDIGIEEIHKHDVELFNYAMEKINKMKNVTVYNKNNPSGIIAFNVKDVFPQDEATYLNYKGIAVRSGHHCAKMLGKFLCTNFTCRCSTYLYTTKEEIDAFIDALSSSDGGNILDAYFN